MLLTEDIAGWGDDDGDDSDVPTLEELVAAVEARRALKKGGVVVTTCRTHARLIGC